jgi:hypothetical protein
MTTLRHAPQESVDRSRGTPTLLQTMSQVDILTTSELSRFDRDYRARNRPAVLRGLRDHRRLRIFDWSVAYFAPLMAEQVVPVMATKTGFLSYERNFVDMPFQEFARRVFEPDPDSGTRYYYKNPTKLLPPGHDDSDLILELRPYLTKAVARNLWMSSSGLTVGLHFDPADNLNFQLRGRKTFWLYPPGIEPYYPLPMLGETAHISGVFRHGPQLDRAKFPRFDPDAAVRIELEEGDILYIPAYWWHQVESLARENVNLNFWWFPSLFKQVLNPRQALRGHAQVALRYLRYGNIQQTPPDKNA